MCFPQLHIKTPHAALVKLRALWLHCSDPKHKEFAVLSSWTRLESTPAELWPNMWHAARTECARKHSCTCAGICLTHADGAGLEFDVGAAAFELLGVVWGHVWKVSEDVLVDFIACNRKEKGKRTNFRSQLQLRSNIRAAIKKKEKKEAEPSWSTSLRQAHYLWVGSRGRTAQAAETRRTSRWAQGNRQQQSRAHQIGTSIGADGSLARVETQDGIPGEAGRLSPKNPQKNRTCCWVLGAAPGALAINSTKHVAIHRIEAEEGPWGARPRLQVAYVTGLKKKNKKRKKKKQPWNYFDPG